MRYQKLLLIIGGILFFLAAVTFYLNRVIFPGIIKKIVVERLEETLKRKVEIGSIHFNWVRGFIIDRIKVYERFPENEVFAQADQVSFGVLFFPGVKHVRITIPFIHVHAPSVHLVRTGPDTWNFSDMYNSSPGSPAPSPTSPTQSSPSFEMAWGGITINNGKCLIEDKSSTRPWSEYFDSINLKLSLSYQGISYDFKADIPAQKGFIGATVYYQPFSKKTHAQIHLKNIDTVSYLSLLQIPDVDLNSGTIANIDLGINYTQEQTSAQGDVFIKNLDVLSHQQSFKGDIEIRNLDANYREGNITARGILNLNHAQTKVPGLSAAGDVQARVDNFELNKDNGNFTGSIQGQDILIDMPERHLQVHNAVLDNIKILEDKNSMRSSGNIDTQGLYVQWPDQQIQGNVSFKNINMQMKLENNIVLTGELQADHFYARTGHENLGIQHLWLQNAQMDIKDQKNIGLNTAVSMENMNLEWDHGLHLSTSLKADKLFLNMTDDVLKISSNLETSSCKLVLNGSKSIEATPQLEINLQIPLKDPKALIYKGSITLSDGVLQGFSPLPYLDGVELDTDFQNDEATINALSFNVMGTTLRVDGTVRNFEHPMLNILAQADDLNLNKITELFPQMARQYGFSLDGSSFVKVKFEGPAADPWAGNILAVATVKNVSASSSKWHQRLKNITGIVEATPNTLKWRDFTAVYLDKKYNFSGSLEDFKRPNITTTLSGPGLELKAEVIKDRDLLTINYLTGKYLNTDFDSQGTIALLPGQEPFFHLNSHASLLLENLVKDLPSAQRQVMELLNPTGLISMSAELKGSGLDWKNYNLNATVSSPNISLKGYNLDDTKINIEQDGGKIKNATFDGKLYDGTIHAVGSLDLLTHGMPYELALNIDGADLHKLKMDSPLKMEEINGKFYLTAIAHGTVGNFKNDFQATGSLAIRDGFLAEFNLFKGILSVLNDALRLGQVMITDVDGNFAIDHQRVNTDNLRLKGPTIVLLTKGWVDFEQMCDLNVTVDLSSGVVPAIAHDVLSSLDIHIYDRIDNPKFKKKLSVPQVINTLLKNFLQ